MNQKAHDLFEKLLAEVEAGKSLQAVLDTHPEAREQLEPLLKTAIKAAAMEPEDPSPDAIRRSRSRMLVKAAEMRGSNERSGRFGWLPRYAVGIAAALLILVSGYGLLSVSAQSLPGDILYPVKRSAERLRLGLTANDSEREVLEESFEERRADEVESLLDQGRVALVSFEGTVDQIGVPTWFVDDIRVLVNEETRIIGEIHLDDEIEVEGETHPDGYVLAFELHKQLMTIVGSVNHIGADHWEIQGRVVGLTPESEIEDDISIGDFVIALVAVADDSSLSLIEVRLEDDELEHQQRQTDPEQDEERIEFTGTVESIATDTWVVGGRLVRIEAGADLDEDIEVGDTVRVKAEQRGGTLWAFDIDERDSEDDTESDSSDESEAPDDDGELSDDDPDDSDDESEDEESSDDEKDDDDDEEEDH